jgi:PAS domain S-box-containing protein
MKDSGGSASQRLNLLGEIGIEILSLLSVEQINERVFENLNHLLDAHVFGIAEYIEEKNILHFPGIIEKGKKFPASVNLSDELRPAVWCFKNRQPLIINDLATDYSKYFNSAVPSSSIAGENTESLIYYPLIFKEKILGVITVQSFSKNAYSEEDENILKNISVYISTALNNARIHQSTEEQVKLRSAELLRQKEELQKSYNDIHLLSEIGKKISASLSVDEIIVETYESIKKLMDAHIFGIAVAKTQQPDELEFHLIEYEEKLDLFPLPLKDKGRPGCICFNEQRVVYLRDFQVEIEKINPAYKAPIIGKPVGSLIYVPLTQKDKKIGVITVQHYEPCAFTERHVDILKSLAVYVSSALENAMLYRNMETEVVRRTEEVTRQKNELETVLDHIRILDEIGQEITATLDFNVIFTRLHASISRLMNTDVFGIRVFHPEKKQVEIKYEVVNGQRDDGVFFSMENKNNLSVWCYENKKEIFINHNVSQKEFKKYVDEFVIVSGEMPGSLIFCPMTSDEKILGLVTVQSYSEEQYTGQHLNIIKTLANYAAIALENAEKYEHINRANLKIEESFKNIKVLSEIGQKITSTLSLEKILGTFYEHVNKLMDATEFGVATVDEDKNALCANFYIFEGKRMTDDDVYVSLNDPNRISAWSLRNRKEVFINDIQTEYIKYIPSLDAYRDPESGTFLMGSLIYLPLIIEERVIGGISVQSPHKNAYSQMQLEMFRTLASYTAIALNNSDAYQHLNRSNSRLIDSYRNIEILSRIGQKITSTLNLDTILEVVYSNITQLLDANEFGVGIYQREKNIIDLSYYIYEGKRLREASGENPVVDMNDEGRLSVWCIKNKKEVVINNIEEEYHKYIPSLNAYRTGGVLLMNSLLCLPLMMENNVIGIISVQSPRKNAYSEVQLEMFRTISSYTAVALNNAEAYLKLNDSTLQLNESFRNIKVLSEIGQKITSTLDFDKVLQTVHENVNLLMDASMFAVLLYSEEKKELTYQLVIENGQHLDVKGNTVSADKKESLAAWCVRNREEILIGDLATERSRYVEGKNFTIGDEEPLSLIYVPLIFDSKVIGVMSAQSKLKNAYTQQHVEILQTLAAYSAIALDNALIYMQLDSALHEVQKLSIVASKTNNTVIICGPNLEIVWANEAFVRNCGYQLDEFREQRGNTLLEISGREEIAELVNECVARKRSVSYESANVSKSGEKIWFHTTLTPVFDEAGNLKNIVAIDADITALKNVEEKLTQKNKDITDSINYALRIQNSILPAKEKVKELLPDSFVLYRPKDIVSGDFYWVEAVENNSKVMVAVVDCTGHGVPGAFITIVGNSLLNQIVNEQNIIDPRQVVLQMNKGMINRLSVSRSDNIRDGMDMALCVFDRENEITELVCSGAYNPVYYIQEGELKETVPIRHSIGSIPENEFRSIPRETIRLNTGDTVYLATDGFADQLGGENGKKFLKGKFKKLLEEMNVSGLKMYDQKVRLKKTFDAWKGGNHQTDDVLMIGFRI